MKLHPHQKPERSLCQLMLLAGSVFMLAACGGGGGGLATTPPPVAAPSPTPTPPPPAPDLPDPTPTPAPPPTEPPPPDAAAFPLAPLEGQFNTVEFRRSDGSAQHNAASAWAQGASGDGVTIAIIDTGIDPDSPEFAGRLSPDSIDIFGTRPLEGPDDHGTRVALVSSAARDGRGILGIAWQSTVMAIRADDPGTCDAGGTAGDGCLFSDSAIADSIDHAVASGAKVINISLGGGGGTTPRLRNAVRTAVDAGALIVIASSNEGLAQLDDFASQLAAAGDGGLLVVGSLAQDYSVSDFSNRAGDDTDFYLTARGEAICCVYEDGELFVDDEGFVFLYSGTSFASPQVAGAAALLAQAFPNLTGREIAEILLTTAFDAGEAGPDSEYGQGILNIAAAFAPVGQTSIAGSGAQLGLHEITGTGSPAMGDALTTAAIPTLILDRYNRAFTADLGGTLQGAAPRQLLHGALAGSQRQVSAAIDGGSVAFSIDDRGQLAPLRLSFEQGEQAQVLAAQIAVKLDPKMQLAFGYASSGHGLATSLRDARRPVFIVAGHAQKASGLQSRSDIAFAVRRDLGGWGLTLSAESGALTAAPGTLRYTEQGGIAEEERLARFGLSLDRRWSDFDLALGATWLAEEDSVLGARFHDSFDLAGADSMFLDADIGWEVAPAWRLGVSWREGFTRPRAASIIADGTALRSRAWAVDVSREGVFGASDTLALRVSQPLRVEGGALALNLPVAYDYATLTPEYGRVPVSLTPEGREMTGELAWRGALWGGYAATSVFYRREPGHYARLRDDAGFAVRWSRGF